MKKILLIAAITLGFSMCAKAQFFEFLNKAIESTDKILNTSKDIKNYSESSNKSSSDSYTSLGTCSAIYFNSYGSAKGTIEIVMTSGGTKKVRKNGTVYNYYENPNYDSYSTNSQDKSYYKYYVDASSRYYFNW